MKLSILDQSPRSAGKTEQQALQESMRLAQAGEELGYTRYWIAEHHDMSGLTCPAPEVMLAYIGAQTSKIRIGSGAILLPHYKPYKVAEVFNLLSILFPNRIDLGIGRAPGGPAEATIALSGNFLEQVRQLPEKFKELLQFLYHEFPAEHMYANISPAPLPAVPPEPWLLGTNEKSAILAAETGVAYVFGHFMSEKDGAQLMNTYKNTFTATARLKRPKTIIAVAAICAETTEQAEELALSGAAWRLQLANGEGGSGIPPIEEAKKYIGSKHQDVMEGVQKKTVIGNSQEVKQQLLEIQARYKADEIMIVTTVHSFEDRIASYRLIANEILMEENCYDYNSDVK
ncbi:LLM class flavin-dependent oxidoreductase [Ectobacillus funiculus]|uniref:LLM class flavin-dependent oxidoreductase n=1 Tax=Ectobacillus funiculus TaxID=137993 RepID=UPI00101D9230|nr:LLM class flavin-dependent oxidoreductase [Ectobacillus funiculus]